MPCLSEQLCWDKAMYFAALIEEADVMWEQATLTSEREMSYAN